MDHPDALARFDLESYLRAQRQQVDAALENLLFSGAGEDPLHLHQAMREAVLGGGKRLRPCLVLAAAEAIGANGEPEDRALTAACAVELVHCYSLIHDDLPALDDDDVRRGAPTCHRRFSEATAVLAGDGLLTLAFELLAQKAVVASENQRHWTQAILELARANGADGIVGGQALDLSIAPDEADFSQVERCHLRKTAALFAASAVLGGLVAGGTEEQVAGLRAYGQDLGLAFQHADDLADNDFARHAPTARARATRLCQRAGQQAKSLGPSAAPLSALARWVERRALTAGPPAAQTSIDQNR